MRGELRGTVAAPPHDQRPLDPLDALQKAPDAVSEVLNRLLVGEAQPDQPRPEPLGGLGQDRERGLRTQVDAAPSAFRQDGAGDLGAQEVDVRRAADGERCLFARAGLEEAEVVDGLEADVGRPVLDGDPLLALFPFTAPSSPRTSIEVRRGPSARAAMPTPSRYQPMRRPRASTDAPSRRSLRRSAPPGSSAFAASPLSPSSSGRTSGILASRTNWTASSMAILRCPPAVRWEWILP